MLKMNRRFAKLSLSLIAALALSGGVARANPLPTSTDEARALQAKVSTRHSHASADSVKPAVSSTDEARALAGRSFAIPSSRAAGSKIVTSTDEARAVAGADHPVPIENERLLGSYAVASAAEHD